MIVELRPRAAVFLALAGPLAGPAAPQDEPESWVVRAERVFTASGDPIVGDGGGFVVVADGKVAAVGAGPGKGDEAIECAAVTPGLVDLSARIDTGQHAVEQSTETPVTLDVLDAADLWSYRFGRELDGGVTSVLLTPPDLAVLGGLCTVVKTGGPEAERVVRRGAVLRASMGGMPSAGNLMPRGGPPRSFYYRRPTTRMGVEWVFRKAYYDAKQGVVDEDDPTAEARNELLERTMRGELPVAVQAWTTQDIRTAVYLKEEFGIPRMFVDAAAEAWKEPELLRRSGMGVVLPPYDFEGRMDDQAFFALDTAAMLHGLGVPVALSGHGTEDRAFQLARQPGFAMRGGLPFDAALAAVTITPARMAGVDDRVGSIEVGKDADLVLWSGTPFEPTSRILAVFLDGKLLVDNRE